MQTVKSLTPVSLAAVEILEGIDKIYNEQKWQELLSKSPEPMINMAKQALQEHINGKSQVM